ncbi:universal stress protein [Microbispora cellulosiformans]|uniref:Universal stress protein n=1 Tax=Microbispora cellulosiformans TaxID=2614688 RepID=A0A5J5JTK7_9ACTN|nr:universal stress protein [Microbispora cellulosiformans]KAA9373921.1 universal stress protein [Microbispora cellulosiformans]
MIVVGVDGSHAALEAAAWAAREAGLRGVPLRVANAIPAWAASGTAQGRYAKIAAWMRDGADDVLTTAVGRVRAEAPEVPVDTAILAGDPRPALIEASMGADLLVVGNHGLGGFRGLLLGSVAHGVAGRAPCDVVVVREPSAPPRGEVVAGIDGSAAYARVLDFAFAEAALRGAGLRVVHAYSPLEAGRGVGPVPDDFDDEKAQVRMVAEALAGRREPYPDLRVTEEVVRRHPVEALLQASQGADLLVVGSHGHGEFSGLLLGSVTQALLHHATVPVAVVRAGR